MLLEGNNAVIYGGGGRSAEQSPVRSRAKAHTFTSGARPPSSNRSSTISAPLGGSVETAALDALDEAAVDDHADAVVAKAGSIDITLNAIGVVHDQGTPFAELSLADVAHPVQEYTETNFITAKAAARHMIRQDSGVILTLSTPGSRMAGTGFLGYGVTCGAIETFSRILAGELGASGIRVVCLRPDAIPEAVATSHAGEVFGAVAARAGTTTEAMLDEAARQRTLPGRFPTLAEVATSPSSWRQTGRVPRPGRSSTSHVARSSTSSAQHDHGGRLAHWTGSGSARTEPINPAHSRSG